MLNSSLEGKKICITGGTGFLGRHLLPVLLSSGAQITCLARNISSTSHLPREVMVVKGDCKNYNSLTALLQEQDILIHMAALLFGNSWNDYLQANTLAAQNIIKAYNNLPEEQRPKKILLISSLAAVGPCAITPGAGEEDIPKPVSAYGWSKLISEKIFMAAFHSNLVILRPPIIYGSGDKGLLPLFKSIKKGIGTTPGLFRNFPVSLIHADDVARAILLVCENNAASGVYHLSGDQPETMSNFCRAIGKALGRNKIIVFKSPIWLLLLTAGCSTVCNTFMNYGAKFFHQSSIAPPHWNLDKYREAKQSGWLADSQKIETELGYRPVITLAEGLKETISGYSAEQWL